MFSKQFGLKLHNYFFTTRFRFNRIEFNLYGVFFIAVGLIGSVLFGILLPYLPKSKALGESQHTIGSGGNTALTSGTGSNVVISTGNVVLAKDSSWWDLEWNYKRPLIIKNLSSSTLGANTPVTLTINTSSLESVLANCNDLRVVQNTTEYARSFLLAADSTNCNDSSATQVTFNYSGSLASGDTDSTNFFLYYGNPSAPATAGGTPNAINAKNPTLVCPFRQSTTCLENKTATTSTGPIRYSGAKSAMDFGSNDEYVTIPDSTSLDITNQITIEAWIKPLARPTLTGGWGTSNIFGRVDLDENCNGWGRDIGLMHENQGFSMMWNINGCYHSTDETLAPYTLGTWYHVASTYDGTNLKIYVNGVLKDTVNAPGTLDINNTDWEIRKNNIEKDQNSIIDELRVSNTVRYTSNFTPASNPFTPDTNTKLLYHFDENGNDPRKTGKVIDVSGADNHGVRTGGRYVNGFTGLQGNSIDAGSIPSQTIGHQGVFLEEATTNIMQNPSMENNVNNFASDGDVSISRSSEQAYIGNYSLKWDWNSGYPNLYYGSTSLANGTYTFSVYVKRADNEPVAAHKMYIDSDFPNSNPGLKVNSVSTPVGNGWYRLVGTRTITAHQNNFIGFDDLDPAVIYYIDGWQVENKSHATSYVDGTLGSGYEWVATAHNSSSTREAAVLEYPTTNVIDTSHGAISLWFKTPKTVKNIWSDNQYQDILTMYSNGEDIRIRKDDGGLSNRIEGFFWTGGNAWINQSIGTDEWHHLALTWQASNNPSDYLRIYLDNTAGNQYSGSLAPQNIDSKFNLAQNGIVYSDLRVFDSALTAGEVSSLYNTGLYLNTQSTPSQAKYASSGTWTSPSLDLSNVAAWGSTPNFLKTETLNGNTITYETRTSANGTDWDSYQTVQGGTAIASVPARYIQIRTTLNSTNQSSTPTFTAATINYLADSVAPVANASNLIFHKNSSSPAGSPDDWTNDLSPYFSWTAGQDNIGGSGLYGYCLYLGQDATGNPASSKGLLGTSPVSTTGTACQFIVNATSLDFSTLSLRGPSWLSSSILPYFLNVRAIDNTGNLFPTSAQIQFRYDASGPNNPSALSAPQNFQRELSSFTIAWPINGSNIAEDSQSGIKGYQYKINSGKWQGVLHDQSESCTDIFSALTSSYTLNEDFDLLDSGENIFYLRTLDAACNPSSTNLSVILKYNADAPAAPESLVATPTNNTKNLFAFSWTAPSIFTGNALSLQYCYTINTSPTPETCTWTQNTSLVADAYATQPGKNTFYIIAKDEAGNINYSDYASVEFFANTSAPGIVKDLDIADISVKSSQSWKLAISWDKPDDQGAGIKTYKIYRTAEETSVCTSTFSDFALVASTSGTSYVDSTLQQTKYSYCVKACDSANNCSAVSSTISKFPNGKFTTPAEVLSQPNVLKLSSRSATISWATDRDSDSKVAFSTKTGLYSPEEPSNSKQTKEHSINLTNLTPGSVYYFKAKWTDEDGNTGVSEEKSFTTLPAPKVKDVVVKNIFLNNAILQFTSKDSYKVKIYYGSTLAFGGVKEVPTSSQENTYIVELPDLTDNTKYYYKINPVDPDGYEYEGTILNFITPARPKVSNVRVQEISGVSQPAVYVYWDSNTETSSIVSFADGGSIRDEVDTKFIKGEHKLLLKGLSAQSTYSLKVQGRDKLGNEAVSDQIRFTTSTDTRPPKIANMKVESVIVSQVNSVELSAQLIISWDTDEAASSFVEYAEGSGSNYSQTTQNDSSLTYNHIVVISNLSPSKVYHFRVSSKDKSGNEVKSLDTVTITPKSSPSALNLVIGSISEMFKFFGR